MRILIGLILLLLLTLCSCVNIFQPDITGSEGELVVSGTITDLEEKQYVYLSRTQAIGDNTEIQRVSGASVSIVDDQGLIILLVEESPGIYATSGNVKGIIGRSYHVEFDLDEHHYESTAELMIKGGEISDVHASYEDRFVIPGTSKVEEFVVAFFADIQNSDSEASNFYKYDWDAVYTIEVPFKTAMDSCRGATDGHPFIPICYVSESSEKFLNILSLNDYGAALYPKHFVTTVAPNIRFMLRFSINVKQYSLTPQAYDYWESVKRLTESTGSMFDPPPTRIVGNVRSTSRPQEKVHGYFMASSVAQLRKFFPGELVTAELSHFYDCDCEPWRTLCKPPLPPDVQQPPIPPPRPFCCDCSLYPNAVAERPDFWIE